MFQITKVSSAHEETVWKVKKLGEHLIARILKYENRELYPHCTEPSLGVLDSLGCCGHMKRTVRTPIPKCG